MSTERIWRALAGYFMTAEWSSARVISAQTKRSIVVYAYREAFEPKCVLSIPPH